MRRGSSERGQTMVEFGIIMSALLIMTAGLIDAGRAFYAYNTVGAAARYAARWGAVVGSTCAGIVIPGKTGDTSDWCNQFGNQTSHGFWDQPGNCPATGSNPASCPTGNRTCPTTMPASGSYYAPSNFKTSTSSTIVGSVAQHFDTNSSSSNAIDGLLSPGLDLSKVQVCISLPTSYSSSTVNATVAAGDQVQVTVYYPFQPAGPLLGNVTMNLIASSTYQVEN